MTLTEHHGRQPFLDWTVEILQETRDAARHCFGGTHARDAAATAVKAVVELELCLQDMADNDFPTREDAGPIYHYLPRVKRRFRRDLP